MTPIAALCLWLFGILAGLIAARHLLTRRLSDSGAHLSELETFFDKLPSTIATTAGSITTKQTAPLAIAPPMEPHEQGSIAQVGQLEAGGTPALPSPLPLAPVPDPSKLKPAEIAFLLRGGDISHTLIVVTVDLIQRAIKTQETSFADGMADYEKNMWRIVSRSVKDWAVEKAHEKILAGAQSPFAIARRAIWLYNFVRHSLGGMIAETIADPRKLKKYFSPGGVVRIIADFTSSGYKQTFQEEIRKSLLRRGLLVPEKARHQIGKRFFGIGLLGLLATFVVAIALFPGGNWVAVIAWTAALIAGFAGRTLLAVRHLLPFYEELAVVAERIKRRSFRLEVVKLVLRSVNGILWLALFLAVTISLGTGFGIIKLIYAAAGSTELIALAALAITNFAIADFIFNGVRLNIEECPTRLAEQQLDEMRRELAHVSPLDTFSKLLTTTDYDPTFSKVLALYGIETLLILI